MKDVLIEPSKITVLIGPNSSGKSSILQFLAILKQSIAIGGSNQRGQFVTRGSLIDLGSFQDIVINHNLSKEIQFFILGQSNVNYELEKVFGSGVAKFSYGCSISDQLIPRGNPNDVVPASVARSSRPQTAAPGTRRSDNARALFPPRRRGRPHAPGVWHARLLLRGRGP